MITAKKVKPTSALLAQYNSQDNVIKQTGESILNYGEIKIMTDQDPDGFDIACLLLQFFSRWPDLFLQGRLKRLNTPLFVARKKGETTRYFYTASDYELEKSKLAKWDIEYMKGLGSLIEEDYKLAINSPNNTDFIYDRNSRESLNIAFGNSAEARKQWLLEK
jgi:DNA gyrase/topoisomerase IV subunit B